MLMSTCSTIAHLDVLSIVLNKIFLNVEISASYSSLRNFKFFLSNSLFMNHDEIIKDLYILFFSKVSRNSINRVCLLLTTGAGISWKKKSYETT